MKFLTYRGEQRPTPWEYDRLLINEARRLGIRSPLPRPSALNEAWRRYLEQQIGRTLMLKKLVPRKPGQRGPGKKHETRITETGAEPLARRRETYHRDKGLPYPVRYGKPKSS